MTHFPYKWKALLTVAFGTMLATIDAGIINIAFPQLTRVFHTDLPTVMWVTLVYIFVSSGSMLAFGKLSDSMGRKRIYTMGLMIFTIGLALCSAAGNIPQIIFCRAIQAVGAAMSIGCGTAIVTEAFPPKEMGRGLGMLGIAVSTGFVIGPIAGGFLLDWLGWRAIFFMRIPLGILAFMLAFFLLRKDTVQRKKLNLDIPGAVTSFAGLFCLLLGMGQIKAHGFTSWFAIILLTAALVILFFFLVWESHAKEPIVDLRLFRSRDFSCAMAGLFVFFLTAPFYSIVMPFFLMDSSGITASKTGIVLGVMPIATIFASPLGGSVSDRIGPRWPAAAGASMIALSFLFMFRFGLHTGLYEIILVLALLGFGIGVFQSPNNSAIMSAVDPIRHGSVSALIGTARQVSISIGMAMTGSVFSTRLSFYNDTLRSKGVDAATLIKHSTAPAFREVALIVFCLSLAVIILSIMSKNRENKIYGT